MVALFLMIILSNAEETTSTVRRDGTLKRRVLKRTFEDVKTTACGTNHTCNLLMDNTVECFGSNDKGQLGIGESWTKIKMNHPVRFIRRLSPSRQSSGIAGGLQNHPQPQDPAVKNLESLFDSVADKKLKLHQRVLLS